MVNYIEPNLQEIIFRPIRVGLITQTILGPFKKLPFLGPDPLVKSDAGEETVYATREGVEHQASRAIADRYKKARTAPILQDERLFKDFGYTANTPAARQVVDGTYNYPEGMEFYTKLLLQEAHLLYLKMSKQEVENIISTKEFQQYWRRANENIQSSASGIHFGHLKAAGFDKFLSSITLLSYHWLQRQGYH